MTAAAPPPATPTPSPVGLPHPSVGPAVRRNGVPASGTSSIQDPPPAADAAVRRLRAIAVAALCGLITLGLAWELWLAPTGSGRLAVKVLPLLPCLVGLLRHRMYTYRWLSLLVWLYFMEGVVRVATDSGMSQRLAAVEIALCLVLFAASGWYVRRRLKNAAMPAAAATANAVASGSAARAHPTDPTGAG